MIKNITEQLFELGGEVIKFLPEVSDPSKLYHMADDGGIETEVGEFLYGLVKVLQPDAILETGTYTGISAMYMAAGLQNNGHGRLTTVEYERIHKERAEKLWQQCSLSEYVSCKLKSSLEFQPSEQYDMMFLDSEPGIRFEELIKFFPFLKPGGYVLIHDLHRHFSQTPHEMFFGWPFKELPATIVEWIKTDKLRPISFPTPRGLSGFYKPREDDYSPYKDQFKNKEVPKLP